MHCAKCFFYETDVGDALCDRCGRAYLPEANVYLGLLVLVVGGAAWGLRCVLTGATDPFVRPVLDLGAWATWPVSIVDCPAYGLVLGAWLGMLAAAPILAAILYGKRGGWLLTILLAAVGPSLGLAAATALGVWIAAGWTLRLPSKLTSALLGLAPVIAYWYVATALTDFGKGEATRPTVMADLAVAAVTLKTLPPALRSLAYVPPIAATLVAALACLLIVGIGHTDRWHVRWPGAILALLAAGPVIGLAAFVGVDEIRYGYLLENGALHVATGSASAADIAQLDEFLKRHPTSPRAAEVRACLALALERQDNGAASPSNRAQALWEDIIKLNPTSPWSADARLHLGDAAARQARFDAAKKLYDEADSQTIVKVDPKAPDPLDQFSVIWNLFSIGNDLTAKEDRNHLLEVRRDVLMRLGLLRENRGSALESERALALYFAALVQKGTNAFRERLMAVTEADPKGPLADNVACDLALLETQDLRQLEAFDKVIQAYPGTDGAMLAHLGAAQTLITRAAAEPAAWKRAAEHLHAVQAALESRAVLSQTDPYVEALRVVVDKKLAYVDAQHQAPEGTDKAAPRPSAASPTGTE
jgi:hypothetical protein